MAPCSAGRASFSRWKTRRNRKPPSWLRTCEESMFVASNSIRGAYSAAEVEALRSQFHSPGWSRVVGVRSEREGDNVDVFFKLEDERMAGIVIISAEAKELTFVNIVGPIEVDQLADLGGEFGIPKLNTKTLEKRATVAEKRDHK